MYDLKIRHRNKRIKRLTKSTRCSLNIKSIHEAMLNKQNSDHDDELSKSESFQTLFRQKSNDGVKVSNYYDTTEASKMLNINLKSRPSMTRDSLNLQNNVDKNTQNSDKPVFTRRIKSYSKDASSTELNRLVGMHSSFDNFDPSFFQLKMNILQLFKAR